MKKTNILFVGSFASKLDDDRIGGQMIACHALINSDLKSNINWILLDTTAVLPIQPVFIRSLKALRRIIMLLYNLSTKNISKVLIFSSSGLSFFEKGLMARLAVFFGKKVVFAPRSGLILNDLARPKKKRFIRKVFQVSHRVVCQGKNWKDLFMSLEDNPIEEKYAIIPNWVDVNKYTVQQKENDNTDKITLLYLGWVKNYKGIYDLLNAINKIKDRAPLLKVEICGHGDDYEKAVLFTKEQDLDQMISFHGWVDLEKKMTMFKLSDIYILPSHFEGFPNALLEAMSAGLPIIATDVGAVSSVVENNVNGLLINPKSPDEIGKAILTLYNDELLRETFAKKARETILNGYSKERAMEKFKKLLIGNG